MQNKGRSVGSLDAGGRLFVGRRGVLRSIGVCSKLAVETNPLQARSQSQHGDSAAAQPAPGRAAGRLAAGLWVLAQWPP